MNTTSGHWRLTEQRDDDDDKVKDVPRLCEVVPSKADDLHNGLQGEDHHKQDVEHRQDVRDGLRLAVVVHGHLYHVHEDHDHDAQLKLAADRDVVEHPLNLVLKNAHTQSDTYNIKYTCSSPHKSKFLFAFIK